MMILEAILLLFLIFVTFAVIMSKDLLSVAVYFTAFSFCVTILYLIMGAVDVAFTETVIGTISTIFLVVALKGLDRWCK